MSKKKGLFSWLGLGRQQEEAVEEVTDVVETSVETLDVSEEKIAENVEEIQSESLVIDDVFVDNILAEPEPE
ncbi:signal recognition particle-docking protein FtsY, partial [Colwellia sp. BRX10-4]|nr:signal recognition particle-docking protein FtsY [Colwellia sp. BRX10-4]